MYSLRAKFNDALNDSVARIEQKNMMINSCNSVDHFDQWGNLSRKGKLALWLEIDDLLERFDGGDIKLLPSPNLKHKQKTKRRNSEPRDQDYNFCN